jgi:iron complex outermembrane recepter protein
MNHHALGRAVWRSLAAVLAQCLCASPASAAIDDECELDLPPGPMEASVLEIARRCNVVVSFRPALMEGRSAPAVRGRFTARQAFGLAVQSSSLAVEVTPGGTVTLAANTAPPPGPPAAAAASSAPAQAATADDHSARLPPVVVTGAAQSRGLQALRSWSGTRTDTPLAEVPQAVSVLTSEALTLQGGDHITDAAAFVPGLMTSLVSTGGVDNYGSTGLSVPSLTVRGMPAAYALSGLRMIRGGLAPDNIFLERVEVPKGPSGVIDAVADWKGRGGVVNLVLKEAPPYEFSSVSQSLSSRDSGTVRLTADVGRPWSDNASWRLAGYGTQSGRTAGGYDRNAGAGLLATSTVRLGGFTGALTLLSERHRDTPAPAARGGYEYVDGRPTDLPAERTARVPADPTDRQFFTANVVRVNLRWTVAPQWSLTMNSMVESFKDDVLRHQSYTAPQDRNSRSRNASTQWGLLGEIGHGGIKHRVLLGLDASRWRAVTNGVDIQDGGGPLKVDIRESKAALLLQDEVSAGPLRLRAAIQRARTPTHDEFRQRLGSGLDIAPRRYLPVTATNWDAGALYQLRPTLGFYVGAQDTTEANLTLPDEQQNGDGMPIPPSVTRQIQAGLKFSTANRQVAGTIEVFRIRQANFKLLNTFDSTVAVGRSSDGLEFELSGRPVPRIDLSLGFTYLRTIDGASGDLLVDSRAAQVPARSLYLLSRIRLDDGLAHDPHLGVAFRAASATLIGFPYYRPAAITLPGGGQLDLSWDGGIGSWTIKAALQNVFDQRLFGPSADTRYIPLQPGRSVSLIATYTD